MAGYIATSIKSEAIQVLSSDKDNDPVLACWQYGLGRTVAFTSDVTNQWTGNYAAWSGYPEFWKNIINWITDIAEEEGSKVSVLQEGNSGKIVYTTPEYSGNTKIMATITDADGKRADTELKAVSPGVYEGETKLENTGIYSVNVKNTEGGTVKDSRNTRLAMQYSQEYRFADVTDSLESFVNQTAGKYIENLEGIFDSKLEEVTAYKNLTLAFLIASAFFLIIDIVYRRLDIRLGAKLASVTQEKIATAKETVQSRVPIKETATQSSASTTATVPQTPSENKNTRRVRKKQEDSQEMLDVGSLLKKQKERER